MKIFFIIIDVTYRHCAVIATLLLLCLYGVNSASAQGSVVDYTEAYGICSPVAHKITKTQCSYARVFESYYTSCMNSQGFSDADNFDVEHYDRYLDSYKYCSSVAETNTQSNCSYGIVYKKHYDNCMAKHGFDEYGQQINGVDQGGDYFKFDF